ncbi:hypothetical protein Zmor_018182 [Zophobas morio]|uniref:Uncharacterized protein n=1 Tax=Zophobas morio TaxID=2755281 RepID=A0AA38ICW1_9CUCU|nr:hypothetical protein Zmor_018182 [Zophobas morio]
MHKLIHSFVIVRDPVKRAISNYNQTLVFLKTPSKPIGSIATFSGSPQARNVLGLPHSVNLNEINAQTAQNILLELLKKTALSSCTRFSVCIACLNADGREEISKEKILRGLYPAIAQANGAVQTFHSNIAEKYWFK